MTSFEWNPKHSMSDFELAILNAIDSVFGNQVTKFGCFFHFKQSIIKWFNSRSNFFIQYQYFRLTLFFSKGKMFSYEVRVSALMDIDNLHNQPTLETFQKCWELFKAKWQPKMDSFITYFEKIWVGSPTKPSRYEY